MEDYYKSCISALMMKGNYWGLMLSKFDSFPDDETDTIQICVECDGNIKVLYNNDLFKKIIDKNDIHLLISILEHEGLHILNKHIERYLLIKQFCQNNEIIEIAADLAINPLVKNIELIAKLLKIKPCMPELFGFEDGLLFEEYVEKLQQLQDTSQSNGGGNNANDEKNDNSESQNGQRDENNNQQQSGESNNCTLQSEKMDSEKSKSGNNGNKENAEKNSNIGKVDLISDYSKWEPENANDLQNLAYQIEMTTRMAVDEATNEYIKSWGKLPGDIEQLIEDFLKPPKLPYYQLIKKFVVGSKLGKQIVAYNKINRKRIYTFKIEKEKPQLMPFPGTTNDKAYKLGVLIDTSASVPIDDNGIFESLSGVQQLLDNDKNTIVHLIQIDTQIREQRIIKKVKDIKRFTYRGGGGTNLLPALIEFKKLKVDCVLVFTDGRFRDLHSFVQQMPKRIMWILPENGEIRNIKNIGPIVFYPIRS